MEWNTFEFYIWEGQDPTPRMITTANSSPIKAWATIASKDAYKVLCKNIDTNKIYKLQDGCFVLDKDTNLW